MEYAFRGVSISVSMMRPVSDKKISAFVIEFYNVKLITEYGDHIYHMTKSLACSIGAKSLKHVD